MFQEFVATTILVFAFYAWLFCPRHTSAPDSIQSIEYFPIVEETTETAIATSPQPKPQIITESMPQATFTAPAKNAPKTVAVAITTDLESLSIRQLKALAKQRTGTSSAIKKYSTLTRAQLIQALS